MKTLSTKEITFLALCGGGLVLGLYLINSASSAFTNGVQSVASGFNEAESNVGNGVSQAATNIGTGIGWGAVILSLAGGAALLL